MLRRFIAITLLIAAVSAPAAAQVADVQLRIEAGDIGLAGIVRQGDWAGVRLTLTNQSAANREVLCQWLLKDEDGDRQIAQRRVTLNPAIEQHTWLYAKVSHNRIDPMDHKIRIVDAESQQVLAAREAFISEFAPAQEGLIGICSNIDMGRQPVSTRAQYPAITQHEPIRLATGLELARLPDRWYGLSSLQAMIWTSDGGSPNAAEVTAEMQQALRDWVRRGGHLVLVLPSINEPWSSSPLADLLPVAAERMRIVDDFDPKLLGTPREMFTTRATVFDLPADSDAAVLRRDRNDDPYLVAGRYGFGRVTLIGVDLANRTLVAQGLPNATGLSNIWNDVFGWRSPIYSTASIDAQLRESTDANKRMVERRSRESRTLGDFLQARTDMSRTVSTALLLIMLAFLVYGLAAGPGSDLALRAKKLARYSWLVFVTVVMGFAAVLWGGAWLVQEKQARAEHVTVLDMEASSDLVHAHAWARVFVPTFGEAAMAVDAAAADAPNTLASSGLPSLTGTTAEFLDTREYTIDAAAPNRAAFAMRSTAKMLEMDFMGRLDTKKSGISEPWIAPQGSIEVISGWPSGKLSHDLPGALNNVYMIYCPGEISIENPRNHVPLVVQIGDWPAGEVLELGSPTQMNQARPSVSKTFEYLVLSPRPVPGKGQFLADRAWDAEGFLGSLMKNPGRSLTGGGGGNQYRLHFDIMALSFYNMLPPPNFRATGFSSARGYHLLRPVGRAFDISHLTVGRRVILIGRLEEGPMPVPLTVDGRAIESNGLTIVRWVYDL